MTGHKDLQDTPAKRPKRAKAEPAAAAADPLNIERPHAVRLLGISDRTFARLESEGVLTPLQKGTGRRCSVYDAAVIVAQYLERQQRQIAESNELPRDRKDRSQAELNELRLSRERRLVLPREQVVQEGQAYITAVTAKLRSIPPRMVQAGVVTGQQAPVVEDMVEEAISEMAGWSTALELLKAVDE